MNPYDLILRNADIATVGDRYRADIGVRDGRICAIAQQLDGSAAREIDAAGRLVTPGGVDAPLPPRPADLRRLALGRRLLHRHALGGLRRHHHGDAVRGAAERPVAAGGGRRLPRAAPKARR